MKGQLSILFRVGKTQTKHTTKKTLHTQKLIQNDSEKQSKYNPAEFEYCKAFEYRI